MALGGIMRSLRRSSTMSGYYMRVADSWSPGRAGPGFLCGRVISSELSTSIRRDLLHRRMSTGPRPDNIESKIAFEKYAYTVRNSLKDHIISANLTVEEKKLIGDLIEVAIQWIDANPLANSEEFDNKMKELVSICTPIIVKIYQIDMGRDQVSGGDGQKNQEAPAGDGQKNQEAPAGNGQKNQEAPAGDGHGNKGGDGQKNQGKSEKSFTWWNRFLEFLKGIVSPEVFQKCQKVFGLVWRCIGDISSSEIYKGVCLLLAVAVPIYYGELLFSHQEGEKQERRESQQAQERKMSQGGYQTIPMDGGGYVSRWIPMFPEELKSKVYVPTSHDSYPYTTDSKEEAFKDESRRQQQHFLNTGIAKEIRRIVQTRKF